MAQNSQYLYSSLESLTSVRLLMIQSDLPTDGLAQIRCWIEEFEDLNAPPYYALSYEWGSADSIPIRLNGQYSNVRKNLYSALWNLRKTGFCVSDTDNGHSFTYETTRWIWIDALCINQEDESEKSQQVGIMGQIYQGAIEVFAWLGSREDVDDVGHKDILYTMAELSKLPLYQPFGKDPHYFGKGIDLMKSMEFYSRPYWQRMWIIQELVLARRITVLYDDISMPWNSLVRFQKLLFPDGPGYAPVEVEESLRSTAEKLANSHAFKLVAQKQASQHYQANKLEYWLEIFRESICTDPRDKVYALLGLSAEGDQKLMADYSKSVSEVYIDVISFLCSKHYESRQRIASISQILQESFHCPSELNKLADAYQLPLHSCFHPSNQHLIKTQGICGGVIKHLYEPDDGSSLSRLSPPQNTFTTKVTILRAPLAKAIPIDSKLSFVIPAAQFEDDYTTKSYSREASPPSRTHCSSNEQANQKHVSFKMDTGQEGYAADIVRKGDIICQFWGCDVAAVLRARPGGYDIVSRALVAKANVELAKDCWQWTKKYPYSVPDFGPTSRVSWGPSQHTLDVYLDIVTLQRLTA